MSDDADRAEIAAALSARGFDVAEMHWCPAGWNPFGEATLFDYTPGFSVCVRAYSAERGNPPGRWSACIGLNGDAISTSPRASAADALDAGLCAARRRLSRILRDLDMASKAIGKAKKARTHV